MGKKIHGKQDMTDRTELLLLREQERHGIFSKGWREAHDNLIAFRRKQSDPAELPEIVPESNLYYVQPEDEVYVYKWLDNILFFHKKWTEEEAVTQGYVFIGEHFLALTTFPERYVIGADKAEGLDPADQPTTDKARYV